jgi:hypothetical protein
MNIRRLLLFSYRNNNRLIIVTVGVLAITFSLLINNLLLSATPTVNSREFLFEINEVFFIKTDGNK